MEIFKDIKGYEGLYQISNFGRVKSLDRLIDRRCRGIRFQKERFSTLNKVGNGYLQVMLSKNGIRNYCLIHRLVGFAFISNSDNKPQINHKNGVKADNFYKNLEWVTQSENQLHAYKSGLQKIQKGSERGRCAKLNEKQVKEIKNRINSGELLKILANEFNVNPVTISNIKTNTTWQHV